MVYLQQTRSSSLPKTGGGCVFSQGPATLDLLLAEIGSDDAALMDACLDLRVVMMEATNAEAALALSCRIRGLLEGRHHLAFYRVRRWLQQALVIEVRSDRLTSWERHRLPLDFARIDELVEQAHAAHALDSGIHRPTQVRFRFAAVAADPQSLTAST